MGGPKEKPGKLRIVLAGGGTGGHLFPGLALAAELQGRGVEVVGIGPGRDVEERAGREWITVPSPRLPRTPESIVRFPGDAWSAYRESADILRGRRSDAVVGLGGYGSFFPGLAAATAGIPLFLLEQNAVPGRVTRLLARAARGVYAPWDGVQGHLPKGTPVRVLGNPVREAALRWGRDEALRRWGFRSDLRTLLVMGGSQGALGLNRHVVEALRASTERKTFQVIHLAGPKMAAALKEAYGAAGIHARVLDFLGEIGAAYAAADLVLARAGGTSIAEVTARGLPSVLVPYPYAADDHQEANARQLEGAGAAWIVPEAELDAGSWRLIVSLLGDGEQRVRMAASSYALGRRGAAGEIANEIIEKTRASGTSQAPRPRRLLPSVPRPFGARATRRGVSLLSPRGIIGAALSRVRFP